MKNKILRTLLTAVMTITVLPMVANDYLKIYFKDGHTERHFMHLVESISTTKYDLEGNLHDDYQMQQIVMPDTTYSYYLAEIDSMSFTKVDDEQVLKNATAVANAIEPIFNQCESIEDMEQHLDEIKNIDGVENVFSTGTDIVVQVKDWYNIVYNYFLRQEEPLVTHNANELASRLKKNANPVNSSNTTKPKVAIAFQMVDDLSREWQLNLMIDLKENFERKGYEVKIIADEEKGDEKLDTNFYLTRMFDYDMLLLFTHGLSYGGKHALYTGEGTNSFMGAIGFINIGLDWVDNKLFGIDIDDVGIASCNVGTERLGDGTYKEEVKYYWYVSEDLIKKSSAKFNGQGTHIVFIGACEQLKGKEKSITFDDGQTEYYGDSFAQILFNKGADFVAGYTKKALRSGNASNNFYRNLLNGFSLEASLAYLPGIQKKEITVVSDEEAKGARLIGLMNPNADENTLGKYFLFKTKTEQVSETYKSGNAVVSGIATTEYPITKGGSPMESSHLVSKKENGYEGTPIKLRCGFRHGLDPNLSKDYQETYCENPDIEENTMDNVHFSCNIALPPVYGTYYYQAFTYDGMNYNYGKICSFPIFNAPVLSENSISLQVGNTGNIRISSGSGDYEAKSRNPEIATATVNKLKEGNAMLLIQTLKAGSTTITVTDIQSGLTTTIAVTVTEIFNPDVPAEPIDLGLPSGTKWASYNIGATKPEEYGGYYAWGETEVRDQYYFTTYSLCDGTVSSCHDIGENISGTEYDVAHVKWGGDWCMPTKDDFQELVYTCEYKETTRNGVKGYQFTGPNGKYIFLPYTGYYWNTENSNAGSEGCYWSATQTTSVSKAHEMSFKKNEVLWDCYINRFAGLSVRPVIHSPTLADLTLSTTDPVTVVVDDKATIEITSGNGSYTAESDNEDVAIARVYDNASVIIKGESVGTATITVTDTKSGQTATIAVTVTGTIYPDVSPGKAIDLGLPSGTKWASCNVGATKPEEYGGYYAWGETEEKEVYSEDAYNYECINIGSDISGTEYDVAHVKWGGKWCVPTSDDILELFDHCTNEWTTLNGVNGRKFTSRINGNSIFLPAAGYRWEGKLGWVGECGIYWSSTQTSDYKFAYLLGFNLDEAHQGGLFCYGGQSVRPVIHSPTLADLTLSTTDPVTVVVDDKATIEITSGNGSYTAESDNEDVAIARVYDNASVIIKGESVGTATITVTDTKSGQTATVTVTVTGTINPDVSPGEAIDLGLPSGTKWASCNVGATKPEEYGGYYAWGETEEKEIYSEDTYKYYQNGEYVNIGSDISGTEYDVAHMKWGGNWCMPTSNDIKELLDNCDIEWTTLNGVNGRKFTSKINGNSIFLPAAGYRWSGDLYRAGEYGYYWSSTRYLNISFYAYSLYFASGSAYWLSIYCYRNYGRSVRPVARN